MKVAILANSHVAMIKHAVDESPPQGWTPTFFAAPHALMNKLRRSTKSPALATSDTTLKKHIRHTSGGKTRVEFSEYDAFVCVGLTLKVQTAYDLFDQYRPVGFGQYDGASLISQEAFRAAVQDRFSKTSGFRILRALAAQKRPVLFVQSPFPNETFLDTSPRDWIKGPDGVKARAWMNALCVDAWTEIADGFGARVLDQPENTVTDIELTDGRFQKGAKGLYGEDYENRDSTHMNAEYGQIVLDQITDALAATPATAPA